jgi:L-threonylcarbamoyladenylate synthase
MSYFTKQFDEQAISLLKQGGVGLLPTDTIYGLSAVAVNEQAVNKIHKLKRRDGNKPLVVLISDTEQLEELGLLKTQADLVKQYWPGPLSAILESTNIPAWLELGTSSLAVRMPDHEGLRNVIKKVGPIVSTSANWQGMPPATSVQEAESYFGDKLDFYIDVGELVNKQPSTLVKLENGKIKVIRSGAYKVGN